MKLGEIKLEALRIMNINNDSNLLLDRIGTLIEEKRYAKYLNNMFNCINKAIDIINHKKILPQNSIVMSEMEMTQGGVNNRYDVSNIEDFMSISKIVFDNNASGYREKVPYDKEGKYIVISKNYSPEFLTLIYDTKINNITTGLSDQDDVPGLPDDLARLIPYYIKFELYQEDEPNLAMNSRQFFDSGIESLRVGNNEFEEFSIEKVYSSEDF